MGHATATDITMASSTCFLVVLLLTLLVENEGRVVNELDVISVPDEFPSRCDDPKSPCKCLDKISTKVVKDGKGIQHKVSFVSHVCDIEKNKELEQPANLQCEQITSDFLFTNSTNLSRINQVVNLGASES